MTLLPDLPAPRRTVAAAPPDGAARAINAGRRRRRRALLVPLSAITVLAVIAGIQTVTNTTTHGRYTQALPVDYDPSAGPSTYLAYLSDIAAPPTAQHTLTLRSVRDGSTQAVIPLSTALGTASLFARGHSDIFLLRRARFRQDNRNQTGSPGLSLCGGVLTRIEARTGREKTLAELPLDTAVISFAVSASRGEIALSAGTCRLGAAASTPWTLSFRSADTGREVNGKRGATAPSGRGLPLQSLGWSPDGRHLVGTVGGERGVTVVIDPATPLAAPTVIKDRHGCRNLSTAWANDGIYAVSSCDISSGTDGQHLSRYDTDGAVTTQIPLPSCTRASTVSADAVTGHVLLSVNAGDNCRPNTQIFRVVGDMLTSVPMAKSASAIALTAW